jgi:hypothetical protein
VAARFRSIIAGISFADHLHGPNWSRRRPGNTGQTPPAIFINPATTPTGPFGIVNSDGSLSASALLGQTARPASDMIGAFGSNGALILSDVDGALGLNDSGEFDLNDLKIRANAATPHCADVVAERFLLRLVLLHSDAVRQALFVGTAPVDEGRRDLQSERLGRLRHIAIRMGCGEASPACQRRREKSPRRLGTTTSVRRPARLSRNRPQAGSGGCHAVHRRRTDVRGAW